MRNTLQHCRYSIEMRKAQIAIYRIKRVIQGLLDFSSGRIQVFQSKINNYLRDNWWQGLSCIKKMINLYFHYVAKSFFVECGSSEPRNGRRISTLIGDLIFSCESGIARVYEVVVACANNSSNTVPLDDCMKKMEYFVEALLNIEDINEDNIQNYEALSWSLKI